MWFNLRLTLRDSAGTPGYQVFDKSRNGGRESTPPGRRKRVVFAVSRFFSWGLKLHLHKKPSSEQAAPSPRAPLREQGSQCQELSAI